MKEKWKGRKRKIRVREKKIMGDIKEWSELRGKSKEEKIKKRAESKERK